MVASAVQTTADQKRVTSHVAATCCALHICRQQWNNLNPTRQETEGAYRDLFWMPECDQSEATDWH